MLNVAMQDKIILNADLFSVIMLNDVTLIKIKQSAEAPSFYMYAISILT